VHGEQNQPAGGAVPSWTQDAAVDAVLDGLVGVADLPPSAQVALLDDAHQRLQDRLAQSGGAQSSGAQSGGDR